MHAAAVSFGGVNYLFPAFGGVGKTTAIAKIIDRGGKLFGDDLIIVNSREMFAYPIDFSVYPYHLKVLPIKSSSVAGKLKMESGLILLRDFWQNLIFYRYDWQKKPSDICRRRLLMFRQEIFLAQIVWRGAACRKKSFIWRGRRYPATKLLSARLRPLIWPLKPQT